MIISFTFPSCISHLPYNIYGMEVSSCMSQYEEMEDMGPVQLLRWASDLFGNELYFACSFGAEDMVILDMLSSFENSVRIFTLDTGRLPEETYELMAEVQNRYQVRIQIHYPDTAKVEEMVREHGINLFRKSVELRRLCCHVRKVEPLQRALQGCSAWITGLRRGQTEARAAVGKVMEDGKLVKICPLADWSSEQVWSYIRERNVPYNRLFDRGYRSIGCAPCTRAVGPYEDERAGRWYWEEGIRECGMHHNFKADR